MTCALGRTLSSTFGGGPSGSELLQRGISETLTVFGLAPKGSISYVPVTQLNTKRCCTACTGSQIEKTWLLTWPTSKIILIYADHNMTFVSSRDTKMGINWNTM